MSDHKAAEFPERDMPQVVAALRDGLKNHFAHVDVDVVACPDLTEIGLASTGMCGSTALFEFGGEPYAHNPKFRGKNFSVSDVVAASGIENAKVFGAAMADAAAIDGNCGEMISNVDMDGENHSRVARVGAERECIVEHYPALTCGPIANLFISAGQRGAVIRVDVRRRIGDQFSLTQAMRESLSPIVQGEEHIGLGGVFELLEGKIRSHVMPNYECIKDGYYDTDKEQVVRDFLQFYEHMGPGLLFFCALWTGDPTGGKLNLRPSGEHTHFYHPDDAVQQAGHYHGDVSSEDVHYRGYFNIASEILRFGDVYEDLGITP